MMWWYDGGSSWVGWTVMIAMMLSFLVLVGFGVVAVYRLRRDRDEQSGDERSETERLLDEWLVGGEIDLQEYRQCRELLRSGW